MTIDRDTLIDYVMGALTPDEEREVAEYLGAHPEDAAYVRDMFETVASIALSETPAEMPADASQQLINRIRQRARKPEAPVTPVTEAPAKDVDDILTLPRETETPLEEPLETPVAEPVDTTRRGSRTGWWLGLLAAAAIAIFAVTTLFRTPRADTQIAQRLEQTCNETGVTCEPLVGTSEQPIGTVALRPDNRLFVVLDDAPPNGQVYQAWEIVGDTPRSLGVFEERALAIDTSLAPGSAFGISVEPPGGSPAPTTTPIAVLPLEG